MSDSTTQIIWPDGLSASRDMTYESIELMYDLADPEVFGDKFAFVVAASTSSLFKNNDPKGLLHKLEVTTMPDLSKGKLEVTHEVLPGLSGCSRVTKVSDKLMAAGFDCGAIVPIKNFGPKKTFNCDVRARLHHHIGQITSLVSNSAGSQLASADTNGVISLYDIEYETISRVLELNKLSVQPVTSMAFVQPCPEWIHGQRDPGIYKDENLIFYTTFDGSIGYLDSRCRSPDSVYADLVNISERPSTEILSICPVKSIPGQVVFFGGCSGELFSLDLRFYGRCIYDFKCKQDKQIGCIKEIVVQDGPRSRSFIAYTSASNKMKILDLETMKFDASWTCDRSPEGRVKDIIQLDNRIITCGEMTSIGCWEWKCPSAVI